MEYILHIVIMLNIYILLVLSANLPIGMANLLSMCQAAFYGIGAYISAYFLMQFDLPFIVVAAIIMFTTGLFSYVVSFASVKLKGDYFILASLGFQMIVYTILYNWTDVTRGPYGIPGIPGIKILGIWSLPGVWGYCILTTLVSLAVIGVFRRIKYSPYGRVLKAMRSDELSVQALGRNTMLFKAWAFFLSAAFSGLAGLFYASYVSYIDPTSFTLDESIFIVSALFIGGVGNIKGPVLGAVFVVLLPEILRFVGMPDAIAANMRQIIYGGALILVMYFRPQGLWGENVLK
ncbi:branched-chain amino acid ABC transporter permease [Parabacteroides sp. AF17-28]|jgi:branched-chain amino acid transport system permease protein|uniref:branched-chain amino acid ABC transporter permease n=1 Tax=Parabacteroides sp. AF17-28 TaxID=2292241 RepID=UPI000EFF8CAC|nr:branched-chain amino acid ABC transporter permease [Parabacteroides sp. AF17-28]RHR60452.1 branched-chain amino acid ABC transporter permease [Parabacteroides sp. AF17-28]